MQSNTDRPEKGQTTAPDKNMPDQNNKPGQKDSRPDEKSAKPSSVPGQEKASGSSDVKRN